MWGKNLYRISRQRPQVKEPADLQSISVHLDAAKVFLRATRVSQIAKDVLAEMARYGTAIRLGTHPL